MELQIKPYQEPSPIEFNFDELKSELTEKISFYKTVVYTDDQISAAKKDRAALNKLKDALNDERKRREKEYMAPFVDFKAKIDELIGIVKEPVEIIDSRVKEFEAQKKAEKKEQIKALFAEAGFPDYVPFDRLFNESWLNSSCSLARVKEDFKTLKDKHDRAVEAINGLPEYSFEAMEYFKQTLDMTHALEKANELSRIAKAKAEAEARAKAEEEEKARKAAEAEVKAKAEEPAPEVKGTEEQTEKAAEPCEWIKFEACLTVSQAKELAAYFKDKNIAFRAIK